MDSKLLLVKSITLLFRESQLKNKSENSADLVQAIMDTVKNPDIVVDTDFGREVIGSLKQTVSWMMEQPLETEFDKTDLLQRIRVNVGEDNSLYSAVKETIDLEMNEDEIKKRVSELRSELNQHLNRIKIKGIIKEANTRVNFQEDRVDWRHFITDLKEKLEPFENQEKEGQTTPGLVDDIDLNNPESVSTIIRRGKEALSTEGAIQFGWQGLNRMFGKAQGARRGEFIMHAGLQFNFKSGFSLSTMKHASLYNKPYMLNADKTPMLLRLTFENSASDDIMWLYKSLVENETGEQCNLDSVDEFEAADLVKDRMQATGYTVRIQRIDPSEFTFHDLFDLVQSFEADGYEIHGIWVDYLNMMSKRGCIQGPAGTEIRYLFNRVRNFMSKRGIMFMTPHQLSTEAKMLLRLGSESFVQEIANKGYYDSCKTVDQEVDMEIMHHIVKVGEESYLTLQRGKHRKPDITPERDLYTILKFEDVGIIPDDITGRDLSRKYIGGSPIADGGNQPWY